MFDLRRWLLTVPPLHVTWIRRIHVDLTPEITCGDQHQPLCPMVPLKDLATLDDYVQRLTQLLRNRSIVLRRHALRLPLKLPFGYMQGKNIWTMSVSNELGRLIWWLARTELLVSPRSR